MARIEKDLCTISVDTSGDALHRRGHKEAVNRAPLRETMAALFLMQCGYDGREPMLDPMCGSGTFVIEAAEIAARLNPGRSRRFAFEKLASFDARPGRSCARRAAGRDRRALRWQRPRRRRDRDEPRECRTRRRRRHRRVSDSARSAEIVPPEGPPGLVIANPPYGARIGENAGLHGLYRTLGDRLKSQFPGWRVGVVTSDAELAKATGLPFGKPFGPISHGGLRVTLSQTQPLPKR